MKGKKLIAKVLCAVLVVLLLVQPVAAGRNVNSSNTIAVRNQQGMAIDSDSKLWAWGYSGHNPSLKWENYETPTLVMDHVSSIAEINRYGAAVIKEDNSLWFWGEYWDWGEGGHGFITPPKKIMDDVQCFGESLNFVIKTDNSLWVWGDNRYGQLGTGDTIDIVKPIKIMDDVASAIIGPVGSIALKMDGSLWIWGDGSRYSLGESYKSYQPQKILDDIVAFDKGDTYFMAISTDGTLIGSGSNRNGQIGYGDLYNHADPVGIMEDVVDVICSNFHAFAIKKDGSLWAWGTNDFGELGDGTTQNRYSPVKIMDNVASVDTEIVYSSALKTDGSLWAWGGDAGSKPIQVADHVIAYGFCSQNAIALKEDGSVWWWGSKNLISDIASNVLIDDIPEKIMDNAMLPNAAWQTANISNSKRPTTPRK